MHLVGKCRVAALRLMSDLPTTSDGAASAAIWAMSLSMGATAAQGSQPGAVPRSKMSLRR